MQKRLFVNLDNRKFIHYWKWLY